MNIRFIFNKWYSLLTMDTLKNNAMLQTIQLMQYWYNTIGKYNTIKSYYIINGS